MYTQQSQATRPANQIAVGYILAFAGPLLISISVSIYVDIVASGVAEEKSSRVMEILVNAATPFQLLAGKIVGIGAACLTQMGHLVGNRSDHRVCYSCLCLVYRAPVSPGRLDIWAAAWPGTLAQGGRDELVMLKKLCRLLLSGKTL